MVSHKFISFDAAIKRLEVQGRSPEELIGVIAYKEKNLDVGHVITSHDVSLRGIGRDPDPRRQEMIEHGAKLLGMVIPTWFIRVSDLEFILAQTQKKKRSSKSDAIELVAAAKIFHVLSSFSNFADVNAGQVKRKGDLPQWYAGDFPARDTIDKLLTAIKEELPRQ